MPSTFVFTANTYAGSPLLGFQASTLLEGNAVSRGLITVIPNVKKRKVILTVDDSITLQDPSAKFVDQNTQTTQDERYLDPVAYEFMKEQAWDKLIQSWEAEQLKAGSMQDYDGVVELSDFLIERYTTKLAIANERLFYLGKKNVPEAKFAAAYQGLLPRISADGSTYKISLLKWALAATAISALGVVTVADTSKLQDGDVVTIEGVTGAIADNTYGAIEGQSYYIRVLSATTFKLVRNYNDINSRALALFTGVATAASIQFVNVSNILEVLASVYAQMDPADRLQPDLKVQIPMHMIYAYKTALAAKAINVLGAFTTEQQADYLGIKLEGMNHWFANMIVVARVSNLFLAVDLLSDESSLQTVDLRDKTLDQVVRLKARMKSDTNYQFANEILLMGPTNV